MKIQKYVSHPVYYSFLFFKKARTIIHNILEPKIKITQQTDINEFLDFLWNHLQNNLQSDSNGIYFDTKVKNKNIPMVLSQIRGILILCNNSKNIENRNIKIEVINKMTDYLVKMQQTSRLFTFNYASWDLQDEGIASIWAILALLEAYNVTENKNYLEVAITTFNAIEKHLYTKETSLLHTSNDYIWCLNAASTFSNACANILKYYVSDWIIESMNDSIELCIKKIANDGHYPYNQIRSGTYILSYHPIVMITLENCINSKYLRPDLKTKIIETNKAALNYLANCIDSSNRIFEPEIKHYKQYIITTVTSLLALKGKIENKIEKQLLNNLLNYLNKNKLFLCKNEKNELFNSDLYYVKDILAIEVLYWLDLYQNPSNKL